MQQGQCDALTRSFVTAAHTMLLLVVKDAVQQDTGQYRVVRSNPADESIMYYPPLAWDVEFTIQKRRGFFTALFRGAWKDCSTVQVIGHYGLRRDRSTEFVARADVTDLDGEKRRYTARRSLRVNIDRRNPRQIKQAVMGLRAPLIAAIFA